jgi:hypothetical protein
MSGPAPNEFTASLTKTGWGRSLAEIEMLTSGREFRTHPFRKVRGKGWGTLLVDGAENVWASPPGAWWGELVFRA